jgi:hypothetical protein
MAANTASAARSSAQNTGQQFGQASEAGEERSSAQSVQAPHRHTAASSREKATSDAENPPSRHQLEEDPQDGSIGADGAALTPGRPERAGRHLRLLPGTDKATNAPERDETPGPEGAQ